MKLSFLVSVVTFGAAAVATVSTPSAIAQTASRPPVRVAIFSEKNFPLYGNSGVVTPQLIAEDLRAAGLTVDLLDTDALAQADRFSAPRYTALVLPYGNTYPQEAFANLRRFHQGGGSLITTGIPFTHPAARVGAAGWSASPGWGRSVSRVPGQGKTAQQAAFQIIGDPDRWTGVTSSRFPVQPGQAVIASASLRQKAAGRAPAIIVGKSDNLYVRFFDRDGQYIRQDGPALALANGDWQTVTTQTVAPTGAALADVSLQVQHPGRQYLATDFRASVNGALVTLTNADIAQPDPNAWADLGHTDRAARWGSDGIGVGGVAGPLPTTGAPIAPRDPWHLTGIVPSLAAPRPSPQWLDPKSLPKSVTAIPAIGDAAHPIATLVVHQGDAFNGAVDAWTYRGYTPDRDVYETRQIIARATVAALAKRGTLDAKTAAQSFARLDAVPRPPVYANLTLPTAPRSYETFQPKMAAPARHLYVADVRALSPDERLLLISLQGLVNRSQPRMYLVFDNDDRSWLDEMRKQGATDESIAVEDPFTLLTTFRDAYKGAVVCDPKIYDSPCVAVAAAGADDLVIARTADLATRLNLTVKTDLRGKFKSNADALRYVRTTYLPRLEPYLSCVLDPRIYDKGGLDQIIAARGSTFWITGPKVGDIPGNNQTQETNEVRQLLAALPLGAVVRGFWWDGDGMGMEEEAGVALGSRFGKITLVSDLITNLSVHSGVKADALTQPPHAPAPALDRNKVYLSFTMSDGDNLCTWRGYFRHYFEDPVRGTIPVGWGMGPTLIDLAPVWAKWYYDKATPNDEFICDVSGVAYVYPPDWGLNLADRERAMRAFYGQTEAYMKRMDMKTVRLMNVDAKSIAEVGKYLPGVDFLMPDYGYAGITNYPDLTYTLPTGQSVFRAATTGSGPENFAAQIRARAGSARPAFLNAFIWNWGSNLGDLKKTLELLGPDYVAVLPSQLNALYQAASGKPQPAKVSLVEKR